MRRRPAPLFTKSYPVWRVGITLALTLFVAIQVRNSYSRPHLPNPKQEAPPGPPLSVPQAPPLQAEKAPVSRLPLAPPQLGAKSAILIDAMTGQVLYEQDADTPRPMASTTKIMTALLLCEHTRPKIGRAHV